MDLNNRLIEFKNLIFLICTLCIIKTAMSESNIVPNVYFKRALTEVFFYKDIYTDYSCKELYEKLLPDVNQNLLDNSSIESIEKFEIVPVRNTEYGVKLPRIDAKLIDVIDKTDMVSFYIRIP